MLKGFIESADEFNSLSMADKTHYREQDDGTYVLDVAGMLPERQIATLQETLQKVRRTERETFQKFKELTEQFEGVKPEQVAAWREIAEKVGDKELIDTEGLETALQKRTSNLVEVHKREIAMIQKERDAALQSASAYLSKWKEDRLDSILLAAGTKHGIDPKSYEDLLLRGRKVASLDEKGRECFFDPDDDARTEPIIGPDGIRNLTADDWVLQRKQDTNWFGVSSGGGTHHRDGGGNGTQPPPGLSLSQKLTFSRQQQTRRNV